MKTRCVTLTLVPLLAFIPDPLTTVDNPEIPAFARRYGVSCNLCHNAAPRVTAFGETFAGGEAVNGNGRGVTAGLVTAF